MHLILEVVVTDRFHCNEMHIILRYSWLPNDHLPLNKLKPFTEPLNNTFMFGMLFVLCMYKYSWI